MGKTQSSRGRAEELMNVEQVVYPMAPNISHGTKSTERKKEGEVVLTRYTYRICSNNADIIWERTDRMAIVCL